MDKEYLQGKFSVIEDSRHPSYVEHKLSDVLIIIMSAILCGLDGLSEIMEHAKNRACFFKDNYGIEEIPSRPTVSRILNMLDGDALSKVIIEIMKERADLVGNIIAVDGKAIRSTSKKGEAHPALQILTAYLTESSVVLGQEAIHNKTNEIPVFQAMLNFLDVKEKIITADAMHCQKKTCKKIIECGGDYVFGLKENQKTLFVDVSLFIDRKINTANIEKFTVSEKNRGRYEKRTCYKVTDISWLEGHDGWVGLNAVFAVRRTIVSKGKTTDEVCYYITSADVSAEELLKIVREHWKLKAFTGFLM